MTAPRPWQVWWAALDPTVGTEQAGTRPVVIVSSALHLRLFPTLVTAAPLTTRQRPDWIHRVAVGPPGGKVSYAVTEQVRTIARSRLTSRLGELSDDERDALRRVLSKMVDY